MFEKILGGIELQKSFEDRIHYIIQ